MMKTQIYSSLWKIKCLEFKCKEVCFLVKTTLTHIVMNDQPVNFEVVQCYSKSILSPLLMWTLKKSYNGGQFFTTIYGKIFWDQIRYVKQCTDL